MYFVESMTNMFSEMINESFIGI